MPVASAPDRFVAQTSRHVKSSAVELRTFRDDSTARRLLRLSRVVRLFASLLCSWMLVVTVSAAPPESSFLEECHRFCQPFALPATAELTTPADSVQEGFNWQGALGQSGLLLVTQHTLRMLQAKTRTHLDGPFWSDYVESLSGLSGWNDGNPIITNYVGHPMMGGITGYIQIQNDPSGAALEWDPENARYWKSRFKALGWAAMYSTSYELAPWGEAGIGNVGYDRGTMGYIDLVVTPLAGFGMILLEDYLDKKVIKHLESGGPTRARVLRVILNPHRSIANLLRFERPSSRDTREAVR
jgi:hypothetical protein